MTAASAPVIAIGKIEDLFARRGITRAFHTASDDEGMDHVERQMNELDAGFVFANLVDFEGQRVPTWLLRPDGLFPWRKQRLVHEIGPALGPARADQRGLWFGQRRGVLISGRRRPGVRLSPGGARVWRLRDGRLGRGRRFGCRNLMSRPLLGAPIHVPEHRRFS